MGQSGHLCLWCVWRISAKARNSCRVIDLGDEYNFIHRMQCSENMAWTFGWQIWRRNTFRKNCIIKVRNMEILSITHLSDLPQVSPLLFNNIFIITGENTARWTRKNPDVCQWCTVVSNLVRYAWHDQTFKVLSVRWQNRVNRLIT